MKNKIKLEKEISLLRIILEEIVKDCREGIIVAKRIERAEKILKRKW